MRPLEAKDALAYGSAIASRYDLVGVFDATQRLALYRWIPARQGFDYDRAFLVYRRKAD